jgi:mono/diheme cytochrome c family protein
MKWFLGLWLMILLLGVALAGWLLFGSADRPPTSLAASKVTAAALRDPALIAKGEYLATAGDCAGCHTVRGGARYAGGRALATPFGGIPAPNLTPDHATGLGGWSFEDFWQSLHHGTGRHGQLLYPAFPYTSYTKVDQDDALAIFAYLQSLAPVKQPSTAPTLDFPYSVRNSVAAWRAAYFVEGVFRPDSTKSAQWNRGAYLVQGLGHCNECHAARGAFGGTPLDQHLTGGEIPLQNWYAPDLSTQQNGGLHGWSEQDIVDLLKTGQSARGAAFGPMADVVAQSTQHLSDADLHAMAEYLHSLPPRVPPVVARSMFNTARIAREGEKIYQQHCADCHGKDGNGIAGVYPPLNGNTALSEPTGINAIRMVLLGGFAPTTAAQPRPYSMPPFAQQLNDNDVALVVSYIRQAWTNKAPVVRPDQVATYRHTPID